MNASHRASEIVTSVRAMFRKDSGERLPVSINELILTVLALLRIELHRHGVEVVTQLDASLPRVECDRVQVQQVILNLVMNAIEAMHEAPSRVLRIQTSLSKPYLAHVSIEDTGSGIDPASRERIFRALFTTKSSGMDLGVAWRRERLGLSCRAADHRRRALNSGWSHFRTGNRFHRPRVGCGNFGRSCPILSDDRVYPETLSGCRRGSLQCSHSTPRHRRLECRGSRRLH